MQSTNTIEPHYSASNIYTKPLPFHQIHSQAFQLHPINPAISGYSTAFSASTRIPPHQSFYTPAAVHLESQQNWREQCDTDAIISNPQIIPYSIGTKGMYQHGTEEHPSSVQSSKAEHLPRCYTRDCPAYMEEINQLSALDKENREFRISKLEMYNYMEKKDVNWERSEKFVDLVKKSLFSAQLGILKTFAVKGIKMTEENFNSTLRAFLDDIHKEKDFIEFLVWKWEYQYNKLNEVREFNRSNQINALETVNMKILEPKSDCQECCCSSKCVRNSETNVDHRSNGFHQTVLIQLFS